MGFLRKLQQFRRMLEQYKTALLLLCGSTWTLQLQTAWCLGCWAAPSRVFPSCILFAYSTRAVAVSAAWDWLLQWVFMYKSSVFWWTEGSKASTSCFLAFRLLQAAPWVKTPPWTTDVIGISEVSVCTISTSVSNLFLLFKETQN